MKRIWKYTPELVLLVYLLAFFLLKHPGRSWERVINSDGKGYYAYLPAVFIYHDLDYTFVEKYESKYYPADKGAFKEFRIYSVGGIVNKCFPGVAILWLPFFLAAHLLSWIFHFETDGYSILYQYAIALAAFFYLWLGLRFLLRLLKDLGATGPLAAGITAVIALGTNIIFFVIIEGSMAHVYSFAIITIFLFCIRRLFLTVDPSWFVPSAVLYALILIIRPTNGLVILLVPVLAEDLKSIKEAFKRIIANPAIMSLGIVLSLIILFIPLYIWHLKTGHWIVNSYGEETFQFTRFRFFDILASYNRGWFIYTPVAFVSLFGLIPLYKENRWQFSWGLAFILIFIYIASCWWMWYYASKFGQRVFIDIYAFIAILLFFLYSSLQMKGILKGLMTALISLLIVLNLVQFYQHAKFIFPGVYITKQIYWDSFGRFYPVVRAYIPDDAIIAERSFFIDMETSNGWMNPYTFSKTHAFSGSTSSLVSGKNVCSAGLDTIIDPLFTGPNRMVRVSAEAFPPAAPPGVTLVTDFISGGTSFCYHSFYIDSYLRKGRWTKVEAGVYLPKGLPTGSRIKVYFYNPEGNAPLYIDDIRVDFLTLKDTEEYRHIESAGYPCR